MSPERTAAAPAAEKPQEREDLKTLAREMRRDILTMIYEAGSGHPGGSLSIIDILTVLYWRVMRHDPERPDWPDRDRLVLSKGHACPALYAVLSRAGYFPREQLWTLRKLGSPVQGHPDRLRLPGIEASTGSLGQGLSIAMGMALAGMMDRKSYRVFAILGDGELQEGQCWEAFMSAPKFGLDRLVAIVDSNGGQIDGHVRDVMNVEPLPEKFRSFGWDTVEIDGHDFAAVERAIDSAVKSAAGRPHMIVARTVKGKGVSFMEDDPAWHGKAPKKDELEKALKELS